MAYNVIYDTLVHRARARNEALVGYVAYSLYKKQKAEFYQTQTAAGSPITSAQKEIFHASFTSFALDNLEDQARQLLVGFAYRYLESDIAARERDIVEHSVATKVDQIDVNMAALKAGITSDIARATSFQKRFGPEWRPIWLS